MARQKAIDWSTKSHERKEYLTFNCEWYGYDYYGAEIKLGKTHEEGKFMEQTKKLVNEIDQATGRMTPYYEKGDACMPYTIPFSKENVDK